METINNVTSAASKLIWGEGAQADTRTSTNETGGTEPVSGLQGKGTVDEPFDKGNSENPISGQSETHPASNNHGPHTTYAANMLDPGTHQDAHDETFGDGADDRLSNRAQHTLAQATPTPHDSTSTSGVHATPSTTRSNDNLATLPDRTRTHEHDHHEHDHHHGSAGTEHSSTSTSNTSGLPSTSNPTSIPAPNPTSASVGGPPRPEHETDKTGVIGSMSNTSASSSAPPSSSTAHPGAAPFSGAAPQVKQQGAANPTSEPETSGERSKSTLNTDDIEDKEALKNKNLNDHAGEPMQMHGGDGKEFGEKEKAVKIDDRRTSKAGQPGGQDLGKEEHGTGEQWVKSTGLAAEGGDFDATKPGAGREADRILEQKGIHKEQPGDPAASTSPSPSGTKEKATMGEKIKNKLHIGHKDKP